MARIRTIKPEFWTDEKVVQLPYEARLLFIGLWNFCDDDGYVLDEPDRIKLEILPADAVNCSMLLDLLVAAGILDRIILSDDRAVLQVPSFARHQKISHKTPTKINTRGAKKVRIPDLVRREVAIKYGCVPGESASATCFYCNAAGSIHWYSRRDGKPGAWVAFADLEMDHFAPENTGGETSVENIVLSCRYCNRSKGIIEGIEFLSGKHRKTPPKFRPEGKGRERKEESKKEESGLSGKLRRNPEEEGKQEGAQKQIAINARAAEEGGNEGGAVESGGNGSLPKKDQALAEVAFEILWQRWQWFKTPKGPRFKAAEAWQLHVVAPGVDLRAVLGAAGAYCAQCIRTDTDTAHVVTWINQHRWLDDHDLDGVDNEAAMVAKQRAEMLAAWASVSGETLEAINEPRHARLSGPAGEDPTPDL